MVEHQGGGGFDSTTTDQSQTRQPRTSLLTGWLVSLLSAGLAAGGCRGTNSDHSSSMPPPGASDEARFGFLQVALTDGPLEEQGITAVNICVERVEVLFADDQLRGTVPVSRTVNVLDLREGVTTTLGISQFPVGVIHQVRLILCPDGATVIVNGTELPLRVPSGDQTGIKLNSPGGFEIQEGVTTTIVIDFDAERSIHYAPGRGWVLTPAVLLVEKAIVLAVTCPTAGSFFQPPVTVRGTVASETSLRSLVVNGVDAVINGLDWQATITAPDGPVTVTVEAVDSIGRTAAVSVDIVVDGTPPAIDVVSPVPAAIFGNRFGVPLNLTVGDAGSGIDLPATETTLDGVVLPPDAILVSPTRIGGMLTASPGVHELGVTLVDLAGNVSSVSSVFTVVDVASAVMDALLALRDPLIPG